MKTILFTLFFACTAALLLTGCGRNAPQQKNDAQSDTAIQKAYNYLWSRQAGDGGWKTTGQTDTVSNEALSAFVLFALLNVPDSICHRPQMQLKKALAFLRKHANNDGSIGQPTVQRPGGPNFATSYGLRAMQLAGSDSDIELITLMGDCLFSRQACRHRQIETDDYGFGGWDFGWDHPTKNEIALSNINDTRYALQALRASKIAPDTAFTFMFLDLLQKSPNASRPQPGNTTGTIPRFDGGFYFSAKMADANKGGKDSSSSGVFFRSYATTTCDGILCLLALGLDKRSTRLNAAITWLKQHPSLQNVEGIDPHGPYAQWNKALFFYHLMVRTEVYRKLHWPGNWRNEVNMLLKAQQRRDGSFINTDGNISGEDDTNTATATALIAATNALLK